MSDKRQSIYKGFPADVRGHNSIGFPFISSEISLANKTKLLEFTGNKTNEIFLTPSQGKFLVLKGVSMMGDGNTGSVHFNRGSDSSTIYPCYFSAQIKSSPSSGFNLVLNVDEKVYLNAVDRGTSTSFVGISYIEFDPDDYLV